MLGVSPHCNGCFDVFCLFLHIAGTWCFGIFACRTHCNGCMNVAWVLIWGESWSTKPYVFPCKVAAAGDEGYLMCAAGAGWVWPRVGVSPHCNGCFNVLCLFLHIAVTWCLGIFACKTHCNGCMNVAWGLLWGESWSTKPCVFPFKVAAAGDERYLVCAAGAGWVRPRLGIVRTVMAASMCSVYSCTLQLHGVLESLLAKRIVMAA